MEATREKFQVKQFSALGTEMLERGYGIARTPFGEVVYRRPDALSTSITIGGFTNGKIPVKEKTGYVDAEVSRVPPEQKILVEAAVRLAERYTGTVYFE